MYLCATKHPKLIKHIRRYAATISDVFSHKGTAKNDGFDFGIAVYRKHGIRHTLDKIVRNIYNPYYD